jgi:CMP/dCMP kinase
VRAFPRNRFLERPLSTTHKTVVFPARQRPIVAIDGPAGAGKSSIARRLALALDFVLVDTGAIYRAVALAAQRDGIAWSDAARLSELTERLVVEETLVFKPVSIPPPSSRAAPNASVLVASHAREGAGGVRVYLRDEDVSDAIRTPEIALGASTVSAHPGVRAALLELQRAAGRHGGVVLEGRDIGTVVFPDAEVKFFLTAKPEVRARRRHEELVAKGDVVTFEETLADVHLRDAQDTQRAAAPLRRAEGAILVDSSEMTMEDAVAFMLDTVRVYGRV